MLHSQKKTDDLWEVTMQPVLLEPSSLFACLFEINVSTVLHTVRLREAGVCSCQSVFNGLLP